MRQVRFSNALSEAVSKHIALAATRRETLAWLASPIKRCGAMCVGRLAAHVATAAMTGSVGRRFCRYFQHVELSGSLTTLVVADLFGLRGSPWVLAKDCTNWEFGKTSMNILMICVTWSAIALGRSSNGL